MKISKLLLAAAGALTLSGAAQAATILFVDVQSFDSEFRTHGSGAAQTLYQYPEGFLPGLKLIGAAIDFIGGAGADVRFPSPDGPYTYVYTGQAGVAFQSSTGSSGVIEPLGGGGSCPTQECRISDELYIHYDVPSAALATFEGSGQVTVTSLSYLDTWSADFSYAFAQGTVSFYFGAVPEPATWLSMLAGFGAVGAAFRRRDRRAAVRVR